MLTTMATALNARLITTQGHGNNTNTNNRTTRRFLRVSSSKGGGVLAKDDDASLVVVNGFWGKSTKGIVSSGGVLMSRSTQYYQKKKSRGMVSLKTNASSTSSSSSAKAAAASTGEGNGFSLKTGFSTLAAGPRTAVLFSLWYFFNIVFNVYNKSTLNVFPYPWLISTLQLAATSIWMLVVWATGIQEKPKVSKAFLVAVLPVAFFHMVGHVSACVSFSKMAVSFTHVIKAAEPVFSVILSGPLLGATYSPAVWASLIPIVLGCSMAAMKEVSFSISGFNGAMISNVAMVLRNITSKKQLNDFKAVDGINLYGILGIVGLFYLAPAAVYMEGSQWAAGWSAAVAKVGAEKLCQMLFLSGVFYHLYNQVSYQALTGISPVTFSVGNSLKRVAVIVASVIYFRNPVSPLNAAGSGLALLGAYLYTKATEKKK
jgi:solute carrier family 35 protein E1